jgi:hypothetical protein
MGAILGASEVHHAVETGEGGAVAAVAVGIELLLGENIAAGLRRRKGSKSARQVLLSK